MKITRISWYQVPQLIDPDRVDSPAFRSEGQAWYDLPKLVYELETDDGLKGWGETPRSVTTEAFTAAAKQLLGAEPLTMPLKELPLDGVSGGVYKGLEVGLFDLMGRARGMRVAELLGGPVRDRVAGSYWASRQTPEDSAVTARTAWQAGYRSLKIKAKSRDPVLERIQAMHEVAPELGVIIDPMQRYDDYDEMLALSRALEPYNVTCIEDPLPKERLSDFRRLRQEGPVPIAMHVRSVEEAFTALKAEAVDILNCSPASMVTFVTMVDMAAAAGVPCWHGGAADAGLMDLSYIHAAAATHNCTIPSDLLSGFLHDQDYLADPPARKGQWFQLPEGPGLGSELDIEAVRQHQLDAGEIRV